jgi:hypothetical protein
MKTFVVDYTGVGCIKRQVCPVFLPVNNNKLSIGYKRFILAV